MHYRDLAISLAYQAGTIIKNNFQHNMVKEWKEDNSPVTLTDLAINQLVLDEIQAHYPSHSIMAEEGSKLQASEFVWVCDPVDGTTPFSHGIPNCVFALALVHQGKSILSTIYDPFLDRLFFAEAGQGAYLNQKRIYVNKQITLNRGLIGVVPSRRYPTLLKTIMQFARKENIHIVSLGSTIYMGMLVASGDLLASIFAGKKAHDSAALQVLIEEAGGQMTSLTGEAQPYDREVNGHLITNGQVHNDFLQVISPALPSIRNL
ncbi:MAG: inositol monophosphatase family protein [Candidatus Abawacabacteria bacterium]|nr:inositol monophosphatase family protein [Candidatus Abawacabacteria bacterium]